MNQVEKWLRPLLSGRYWMLKVTLVCVAYCIVTSMPNYLHLFEKTAAGSQYYDHFIGNYQALSDQADHPFRPNSQDVSTHYSKLTFRFVPALLIRLLPTDDLFSRVFFIYLLNNAAGFLFFFGLIKLTFRYSAHAVFTTLVAFNFCVLYVGKSFFHDTYLWNDGIAFAFLLWSLLSPHELLTVLLLLAAFFTDERALFGGILVFVYSRLLRSNVEEGTWLPRLTRADLPFILPYVAYGIIRFLLMRFLGMHTPVGEGSGVTLFLRLHHPHVAMWTNLLALFTIYKTAWFPIITAFGRLRKDVFLWLAYTAGLALIVIISVSVEDMTRSLAYSFMALASGFYLLHRYHPDEYAQKLSLRLLLINFLIPTPSVVLFYVSWIPPLGKLVTRLATL